MKNNMTSLATELSSETTKRNVNSDWNSFSDDYMTNVKSASLKNDKKDF